MSSKAPNPRRMWLMPEKMLDDSWEVRHWVDDDGHPDYSICQKSGDQLLTELEVEGYRVIKAQPDLAEKLRGRVSELTLDEIEFIAKILDWPEVPESEMA